jgi:hypothetical protein
VDPGRALTMHSFDAHYGQAHDLVRRVFPELVDAARVAAPSDGHGQCASAPWTCPDPPAHYVAAPSDGKPWLVRLTCCGRADGVYAALTWEEADRFRLSYTAPGHYDDVSGLGGGHRRSAVIEDGYAARVAAPSDVPLKVCPACGDDASHDWWPVGDDSYSCDRAARAAAPSDGTVDGASLVTFVLRPGFADGRPSGPRTERGHALASSLRRRLPDVDIDYDEWVREIEFDAVGLVTAAARVAAPSDGLREWVATKREVASEATLTYGEHATGFYDALGIVLAEIDRRAALLKP